MSVIWSRSKCIWVGFLLLHLNLLHPLNIHIFKPRVTANHPVLLGSFEHEKTRVCGIRRQRVAGPQVIGRNEGRFLPSFHVGSKEMNDLLTLLENRRVVKSGKVENLCHPCALGDCKNGQ